MTLVCIEPPWAALSEKMEFRKDINGLRAIAVAAVVLFHAGVAALSGGFVGVDVFFVISGFLMAEIVKDEIAAGKFSVATFLLRRLKRIFPALTTVTLVCVIWAGLAYLPGDYRHLVRIATTALTFRSNVAFASDVGYFEPDAQKSLFLHTWSLSVEAQFYVAFAVVGGLVGRWRGIRTPAVAWSVAMAVLLVSLGWCLFRTSSDARGAFYLLASRAWEFMAGVVVAIAGQQRKTALSTWSASLVGAALVAAAVVGLDATNAYPGWRALLPVAGTALIIWAGRGPVCWILNLSPLQFLGRISYSVYLWHWPILLGYEECTGVRPDGLCKATLIGASIVVGWLSYQLIEKPARSSLSRRALLAGAGAFVASGFAFSAVLSVTDGLPQRLPRYLQPAVDASRNPNPRANECSRKVDGTKNSPGDFCLIGSATARARTMILWGDSFADRLQPSVSSIASSLGIGGIVATEGGCPPFRGKAFAGSGAEIFSGCEKYANFVFDYFERNPSISMAVVAGDWQRYDPEYEGNVLKHIAQILATRGGSMVLVSMVPNPRADVPREWARREFQSRGAVADWKIAISDERDLLARGRRIASIASEAGNVIVVDPFKSLCDSSGCVNVRNDMVWYSDTDHLSSAGIQQLVPDISEAMQRAAESEGVANLASPGKVRALSQSDALTNADNSRSQ